MPWRATVASISSRLRRPRSLQPSYSSGQRVRPLASPWVRLASQKPPLRPVACSAIRSRLDAAAPSRPGSRSLARTAVHSPVKPPPTTTRSGASAGVGRAAPAAARAGPGCPATAARSTESPTTPAVPGVRDQASRARAGRARGRGSSIASRASSADDGQRRDDVDAVEVGERQQPAPPARRRGPRPSAGCCRRTARAARASRGRLTSSTAQKAPVPRTSPTQGAGRRARPGRGRTPPRRGRRRARRPAPPPSRSIVATAAAQASGWPE